MQNLGIAFKNDDVAKMYAANGGVKTEKSVGFDLIVTEDVEIKPFTLVYIDLGITFKPAPDVYVQIIARSSTFKKHGIFLPNAVGVIDPDYCGKTDLCKFPAFNLTQKTSYIKAGTPIAQALLTDFIPIKPYIFIPEDKSRGGFGSTDALLNK